MDRESTKGRSSRLGSVFVVAVIVENGASSTDTPIFPPTLVLKLLHLCLHVSGACIVVVTVVW